MTRQTPHGPIDVILRDGRTLRLRVPAAEDREGLLDFYNALSSQSLYFRFHGFPTLDQRLVDPVLASDWTNTGALLGSIMDSGKERIVALANYVRLRDPRRAEFAVSVADAHQSRGIGTRLLEQLAGRAASEGIEYFIGEVMAENRGMIQVFEGIGFEVSRVASGGEVEMIFPIETTTRYSSQVESRDHGAVVASLQPFFEAKSVAVIGASARRGTIGGEIFRNVLEGGFVGAVYPVNRDGSPVAGVKGYSSMTGIPEAVDLAVVAVPAKAVIEKPSNPRCRSGCEQFVSSRRASPRLAQKENSDNKSCWGSSGPTGHASWVPTVSAFLRRWYISTPPLPPARPHPATLASRHRAGPSALPSWKQRTHEVSGSRPLSRSVTKPIFRLTTCSSGGRMIPPPTSSSSTSKASAIPDALPPSPGAWRVSSRFWP